MANKLTKKEIVTMMLANDVIVSNEIFKDYLTHELELLERKATSKKKTSVQLENDKLLVDILDLMSDGKMYRASDLMAPFGISNQKATALLGKLKESGKVVKTYEKRVAYFSVATSSDDDEVVE